MSGGERSDFEGATLASLDLMGSASSYMQGSTHRDGQTEAQPQPHSDPRPPCLRVPAPDSVHRS